MLARSFIGAVLAALLFLSACATNKQSARRGKPGFEERGTASWYGPGFHGKRTANGEVYDMLALTAAHKYLPFDSVVEVTNRANGRTVRVRINDRGPFVRGRIIDLSRTAAEEIDLIRTGITDVKLRVISGGHGDNRRSGSTTGWVVQAGAFRDQSRAERHLSLVRRLDSRARADSDGEWYRVLIGPFSRQKEARRTAEALNSSGIAALVRRDRFR